MGQALYPPSHGHLWSEKPNKSQQKATHIIGFHLTDKLDLLWISGENTSHHLSRDTPQHRYPDADPPAVSSALKPEACCLLMLPELLLRSIPSPSDGPSTHRLQIEVSICRGLWHFRIWIAREAAIIFHIFLKVHPKLTCDEAQGVCEWLVWELWWSATISRQASWKKCIVWLPLSCLSSILSLPFCLF